MLIPSHTRFNRWETLSSFEGNIHTGRVRCKCNCGTIKSVIVENLVYGNSKSCGCLFFEVMTVHGHSGNRQTSTYKSWHMMLQRCNNENYDGYAAYGGRGIKVCKRWHKFVNFLADMGERPAGKTLDRIDNNRGYYKSNCRWASKKEQMGNRRNSLPMLTFKRKTQSLSAWAREAGISRQCLRYRLCSNWSIRKALTTPVR